MKKWAYIVGGFTLGLVVALTTNTAYGAVQSLVGKKVTGEMTVIVNGTKLQDKGAVIEGRTNAPVRALVDALGAELTLSGNTITINSATSDSGSVMLEGKSYSKEQLLKLKEDTENYLNVTIPEMENSNKERYDALIQDGMMENAERLKTANEKEIAERKVTYTEKLKNITEALKQFE